jgi:hypothetical protein
MAGHELNTDALSSQSMVILETPMVKDPSQTMPIIIERLSQQNSCAWDLYLQNSTHGLPTLSSAWKEIMTHTYSYPCHFLLARQGDQIRGVLPLYHVKSALTGNRLDSLPGALCADTQEVARKLVSEADALARELKVDQLLLRDSRQDWTQLIPGVNLEAVELHRGVARMLKPDSEKLWSSVGNNFRNRVRYRQKENPITIRIDSSGLDDFYSTFHQFTHKVGTPLFGKKFLKNITRSMPDVYQIVKVYLGQKPIAGYFNFLSNHVIFGMWGACLQEYYSLNISIKAYWATMEWGCKNGYQSLDMGRSPYPSGQFTFKSHAGDTVYPIYQLFHVYRGKRPIGLQIHDPEDGGQGLSLFRRVWPRLPQSLVQALGPIVRWHIPFG